MAKYFSFLPKGINYDFVGFRSRFLMVSGTAVLAAFILMGARGLNFGIDFSGGTEVQVNFVACEDGNTPAAKPAAGNKKAPKKKKVTVCVKREDLKPNVLRKKIHSLFPKSKPSLQPIGSDGTEFMLKFQQVSFLDKKQISGLETSLNAAFKQKSGSPLVAFRFREDTGNKIDLTFNRALVLGKKKGPAAPKAAKAKKAKVPPKPRVLKPKVRKPVLLKKVEPKKKAASQPSTKKAAVNKKAAKPKVAEKAAPKGQTDKKTIERVFAALGLKNVTIEPAGRQGNDYEYTVTFEGLSSKLSQKLQQTYGIGAFKIQQVEAVGPRVGKKLRNDGILSLLLANLFILIYIAIRFDFRYAPGAVAALLHDVTITTGVFAALQLPFDLTTVAALLTIVGYSLNDTIVVYDRIRENWAKSRVDFGEVMNRSINETLSRTLLTSVTTFLAVLPIYLIGGVNIKWFAFAMMFGILIGTYSSIAIASPLVYWLDQFFSKRMRQEDEEAEAKRERRRRRRAGLTESTDEA